MELFSLSLYLLDIFLTNDYSFGNDFLSSPLLKNIEYEHKLWVLSDNLTDENMYVGIQTQNNIKQINISIGIKNIYVVIWR